MDIDQITKWLTLAGATVGGVTSALTYWSKITEKSDKIKVGFGSLEYVAIPGYGLYVVSRSDHTLQISDYGFFDEKGRLLSIQVLEQQFPPEKLDEMVCSGTTTLIKRGDIFGLDGLKLKGEQIGAYATTANQNHRTLCFTKTKKVCFLKRMSLYWKIRWCEIDWQV
jgi:hypothetical protein